MAAPTQELTTVESGGEQAQVAARTNALFALFGRLKENAANSFKEAKPWGEVFDRNSFSKPANAAEATGRLRKNLVYYRLNYAIVGAATTALVMVMNPWSLIVLALLALVWFYAYVIRTGPLSLGGRELSDRERFLGLSAVSLVTIFFLTSVGSTLFYALGLSALMAGVHAVLHTPDDLFTDELPETSSGFMALLTGKASSVAPIAIAV